MTIVVALAIVLGALYFTLAIRSKDVPEPEPVSPVQYLEDRKQAIYGNLRDLQFEYRLGKLSDDDYQQSKQALQRELAVVLAEMDAAAQRLGLSPARPPKPLLQKRSLPTVCPHCNATFSQPLKFCGECGKPMVTE